jgi:type II restriction enzyme
MLSGNKGEWSEVYTLIKLLADGEVYAADANLNKKPNIYYPILKIIRDELNGSYYYERNTIIKMKDSNDNVISQFKISDFKKRAITLLKEIKAGRGSSFSIPTMDSFLRDINCSTLKAKSSDKRDITLIIHDPIIQNDQEIGLSIKSQLGGKSTLFNASQSTNITYKVTTNHIDINDINSQRGIKKKVKEIYAKGDALILYEIDDKTFHRNLQVVDSSLPEIIGEMALLYFRGLGKKVNDLTREIKKTNPCNYDFSDGHPFYKYKIKSFLNDSAVGLRATDIWTGKYDATGGYLIVREDGEILCYHIYNLNEFHEYLFNDSFLDTPSSTRNKFGSIYKENTNYFMKLNFQIRFNG